MKTLLNNSFLFSLKLLNFQFQLAFIENLIIFLYLQNLRNNLIATHSTSLSDDRHGAIGNFAEPSIGQKWDQLSGMSWELRSGDWLKCQILIFLRAEKLKPLVSFWFSSRQSKVEARQLSVCFTSSSLAVFPFWNQGKIKNFILFFVNLFISKPSCKFLGANFL